MKKITIVYISFIVIFTILTILGVKFNNGNILDHIFANIGTLVIPILVSLLFTKFTKKNATQEIKFKNYTAIYCIVCTFIFIGNLSKVDISSNLFEKVFIGLILGSFVGFISYIIYSKVETKKPIVP
jgi:positive regulator of sigma E activity